ncbi:hypothetical protein DNNLJILF_02606 [Escherichia coli]|nr:hypothetical protein DNNLJILF_02606 [Escherichia coli]
MVVKNGLACGIMLALVGCATKPVSNELKWFTEFGHLNRGDMLTSEQHRCHNEKKKFQRRV